ncbi:hypothetical protein [Streptomyces sp. H27-D2]|uniref:hypothetical protein n=1 Tax=Streptomyces sp. H27-D2 TaxID=3046304 RepID=UPI002DBDAB0E|nr:hypothetical protein [Streptomyces sp. H27-D2]MEC4016637.1 hypothetical protein [Streptomyces sp. H27-D2]
MQVDGKGYQGLEMRVRGESETNQQTKRLELSVAQVAGSALAAVAAAVLASKLGVYGTIIGAGVVSVVATAGGTIFQHLFKRTGEQIREVTVQVHTRPRPDEASGAGPRRDTGQSARASPLLDPRHDATTVLPAVSRDPAATRIPPAGGDATQMLPRAGDATQLIPQAGEHTRPLGRAGDKTQLLGQVGPMPGAGPAASASTFGTGPDLGPESGSGSVAASGSQDGPDEFTDGTRHGTRMRGWKRPALGAAAVFALAMGAVTGVEWLSDGPVSNVWGGDDRGTTLSNSVSPRSAPRPDPAPSTSPSPDGSTGDGSTDGSATPDPDDSGSGGTGEPTPGTSEPGSTGGDKKPTPTPTPTPTKSGTGSPDPGSTGGAGDEGDSGTGAEDLGGAGQNGAGATP